MVLNYAKELQRNTNKYTIKYVSEMVKLSVNRGLISLEDLYTMKEKDICHIFLENFSSWKNFNDANILVRTKEIPNDKFYISYDTKRRNTIPLVELSTTIERINDCSNYAKEIYNQLEKYTDTKIAYIETIDKLC